MMNNDSSKPIHGDQTPCASEPVENSESTGTDHELLNGNKTRHNERDNNTTTKHNGDHNDAATRTKEHHNNNDSGHNEHHSSNNTKYNNSKYNDSRYNDSANTYNAESSGRNNRYRKNQNNSYSTYRPDYNTSSANNRVVRMNVGGMYYTTLKSTLTQAHGSILCRIANGGQSCLKDDRGNYVVDRDGPVFRHVLNYLRNRKLLLPTGFRDHDLLREEAVYFSLDSLVREIDRIGNFRRRRQREPNRMKRLSASVSECMDRLHLEDEDDEFFEDSYIDSNTSKYSVV